MKHLIVVTVVFLSVSFLETEGEDVINTIIPPSSNEVPTKTEKSERVVSEEEEIVLKKWRIAERILQESISSAVRNILPFMVATFDKVNISSQCSRSVLKMMYGIEKMQTWALSMIDASGKIPNGIISGFFTSFGDFDGCLLVDVPGSDPFRGQYCSVIISPPQLKWIPLQKATEFLPEFVNFTKEGTVTNALTKYASYKSFFHLRTSVCVPSTCSREEIMSVIDSMVVSAGVPWDVNVPTCETIEPIVLSKGNVAVICILSVIALLVLAGTIMDIYLNIFHKDERGKVEASSTTVKCLMSFSAYNNTLRLLKSDTSPDSIKIFHGMKVITVLWIAVSHIYGYTTYIPAVGGVKISYLFIKEFPLQVITNGFLSVDTFFFISAVLLAYKTMTFTGGRISVPMYIFLRLWRLTPPFMLVIAASTLIPLMGSGPAWKQIVGGLIDQCKENWWANLVYINNFLPSEKMCFQWFWYIPADTHLYFLSLLVVIHLKSRPKLALGINGLLFLCGTIATAVLHFYYELPPTVLFVYGDRRDLNYILDKGYFRTYVHITVYSIGIFTGYILATVPKLKIPKVLNILGWLLSMALGLLVTYGVYEWNLGNVPGMTVSVLYACTSKSLWALALSYVTIACSTGNGGVITSILSWSAFVPLSRLTFAFYMVHTIVLFVYAGSTRTLIHTSHRSYTFLFIGVTVISFLVAYVVSLMFESPFACLMKVMMSGGKSTKALEPEMHVKKSDESQVSSISMKKIENEIPYGNNIG